MSTGKILLGVLAGMAVGATVGILFAPDKGSHTRRKITRKSDEYTDHLSEKFNEFIDSVTEKFETMKEGTIRMAEDVKEAAHAAEAKVEAKVEAAAK